MKSKLSLLTITKNAQGLIGKTFESVIGLVDEIIVVDDYSTDKTGEIAKKYGAKVFLHHEEDLGKQKKYGLDRCSGEWVLVLDADEYLSESLRKEIKELFVIRYSLLGKYTGFYIPFQNHFLGHPIKYGGENYKMLRLFKRDSVFINPALVHERFEIKKGKVGELRGKIYHHSYRSLWQTYKKFTDYAIREAKQKAQKGEKSSLRKIFLYPLHMFWARFVEAKGYKDGFFRIPLDLGFAYMELLTYVLLFWYSFKNLKFKIQNSKCKMQNDNVKCKIGFIFVLFHTPLEEIRRLKKEIGSLGFKKYKIYFIDNTKNNRGYASGVNEGIKLGLKDSIDIFAIANPDISLKNLSENLKLLEASKHFDIWGYGVGQKEKVYYGGKIDKWRLSGGLIEKKPLKRFIETDFVSGSLMFIKRKVIEKSGFFDESYFMYYEDVDYCFRAKKVGFKVGIDSKLIYEHFETSSKNPQKEKWLRKAHQKFLERYGNIWQKIYDKTKQSRFLLNFFSLNLSSFLNKFLHFILFLFLVRYLTPFQYGIYTLVWAHIGLLLPLLDFGTTSYGLVHLPLQSQKNIFTLFSLRLFLSLIVFGTTIFLALIFRYQFQTLLFIFLTSFVILANSVAGSFLILCSVREKLYLSSLVSLFFNFFLIGALIASLISFKSFLSIFFINFIAYNFYSAVNFSLILKEMGGVKVIVDFDQWRLILKKSVVFLLIGLLANLYFKLDVFLLNFLKGEAAVGLYSSGYKFLEASLILASSYNITSLPIFSKLYKKNKQAFVSKVKKDLLFVGTIGLSFAFLLLILSPFFLPMVLPETYWQSIKILQIVILSLPFILATSVFLNSLYALGKPYLVIFIFLFQTLFNFTLNYLLIPKYSYFASAYITLIGEILNTIISFLILRKFLINSCPRLCKATSLAGMTNNSYENRC